jgi:alpha-amylase
LGDPAIGPTNFGYTQDVFNLIAALKKAGIHPIADMLYNDRTGGQWEYNPAVQNWITTYNQTSVNNGDNPYPSDRYRLILPVGGNTGIGPGEYYFKIKSASQSSNFYCYSYTFQISSTKVPIAPDSTLDTWEYEPNSGGDCGGTDTGNAYTFSYHKFAKVDGDACPSSGCGIDQFNLVLDTSMYNVAGDTLIITLTNDNASGASGWSDHYLYDIWSHSADSSIISRVIYQTQTDFTKVPSGRGYMNWSNFHPSGYDPTNLGGNWDEMLFFYDVDQTVPSTISTLGAYQEWMYDSIGIQGMRVDAVKNYTYVFMAEMLDSLYYHGHSPEFVVGEFYDGYAPDLTQYLGQVRSNMAKADTINMKVFDFALRFPLQDACNFALGEDVRNLFTNGIVNGGGGKAVNSVTWVNNHDFRAPGQYVQYNPELAYAYIITNPLIGTPDVFLQDYFSSNFEKGRIKGLIHASRKYTFGATSVDYLNNYNTNYTQYFVPGNHGNTQGCTISQFHNPVTNRDAIVAINFTYDTLDVYQQINTNSVAIGDTFTDVFAISPDTFTTITNNKEIHVTIPPRSFTMYVQGGDLGDSNGMVSLGDTVVPAQPSAIAPQPAANSVNPVVSVYPNPFTHLVNLQLGSDVQGALQVDIFDLSGRQLYSQQWMSPPAGILQINPPPFASDIYLLKISANNGSYFYKLAKN